MEGNFINNQQFIKNIPSVSDLNFKKIDKSQLYVSIINISVFTLIFIGILICLFLSDIDFLYFNEAAIGVSCLFILLMVWTFLAFPKKKYALRDHDIIYQKGLLWSKTTIVPFNRVQHCEVKQGPIQRLWGLASLKLFTAGGTASDLSISGLRQMDAHKLRNFIIQKTGIDEEE